jgi:hypothetical protein
LPALRPDDAPPRETAESRAKREAAEKAAPVVPAKGDAPAQPPARRAVNKKGAGNSGAFR